MRHFFSVWLALITFCVGKAGAQTSQNTQIPDLESGRSSLKVGHIDFPPFYLGNSTSGLDAEIIRAVAERAGFKKVEFVQFKDLPDLFRSLNEGHINLIANGIVKTSLREQNFLLSVPYYLKGGLGFLYPKQLHIMSTDHLINRRIGVLKGSYPQTEWLSQLGISREFVYAFNNVNELVDAVKKNTIDVAVTNFTVCRYFAYLDSTLASTLAVQMPIAYLLRKNDTALLQKLNVAIQSLWEDQTLYKIKTHYLSPLGIEPAQAL
jgi:ABC-type amino acid transport substrate-binding protein